MNTRSLLLGTLVALILPACASRMSQRPPEGADDRPQQAGSVDVTMPVVTEVLSPNCNTRKGAPISAIVLHHTGSPGSALAIARYFQRHAAQVSSHYVVDRDGTVVRSVPDTLRAWHAGPSRFDGVANVNDYSIGIEICNRGDGIEPYSEAQIAAVTRLVACLSRLYGIPITRITRHRDIALPHGIKVDPSDNFDFAGVVARAGSLLAGNPVTATNPAGISRTP